MSLIASPYKIDRISNEIILAIDKISKLVYKQKIKVNDETTESIAVGDNLYLPYTLSINSTMRNLDCLFTDI